MIAGCALAADIEQIPANAPAQAAGPQTTASLGEELYLKECAKCHGARGEKSAYGASGKLSEMSSEDIFVSFRAYVTGATLGGKAIIMQPIASRISSRQLGYIISYLKDDEKYIWRSGSDEVEDTDISREKTPQGVYIQ